VRGAGGRKRCRLYHEGGSDGRSRNGSVCCPLGKASGVVAVAVAVASGRSDRPTPKSALPWLAGAVVSSSARGGVEQSLWDDRGEALARRKEQQSPTSRCRLLFGVDSSTHRGFEGPRRRSSEVHG